MVTVAQRTKAADVALEKFKEQFGKSFGANVLTHSKKIDPYKVIPTGSVSLDYALGCGGIIVGSLAEIWGPDGSAKTTLSLILAAQAQKTYPHRQVAFLDMEHKLDRSWAQKLGVDLERLLHVQPESAEVLADMVKELITSDMVSLLVVDSIGSMVNQEEKDKDAAERSVGTTPGIITRMVKIAASEAREHQVAVFLINQVRANLGYGADTTTGGGFALKHSTTHRIKARKAAGAPMTLGSGENAVQAAVKIALKVEKNGVASPGRTAILTVVTQPSEKYGMTVGIADLPREAFETGKKAGVITRSGANYTFPDGTEAKGGEDKAIELLRADPKLLESLRLAVVKAAQQSLDETQAGEVADDESDGESGDDY
jgi:recombination protein RecA